MKTPLTSLYGTDFWEDGDVLDCVVAGNVHDNPELKRDTTWK